ncbi:MAG: hypothetical protein DI534_03070 [Leifsonia xyli]|nr:MAG: hypothetical protein DI534_03070 [Leifsonia xyli]
MHHDALAWVESPLQLLSAAEWADRHRRATGCLTTVAHRISDPQMVATAEALHRAGAPFVRFEPYFGIPWSRLAAARHWVIGDPLSGQFRTAAAVLPKPRRLTVVDDGSMVVHALSAIAGEVDYARPGQQESRTKLVLGGATASRLRSLAKAGRLDAFTAFPDADAAAHRLGIPVIRNDFAWLRAAAAHSELPAPALPVNRIALGNARVVDGLLDAASHLGWLRELAEEAPLSYLPHRRETDAQLRAVASLPGVTVVRTGLPIELVLAGTRHPLELHALPTSAITTLTAVLADSGSSIHLDRVPTSALRQERQR